MRRLVLLSAFVALMGSGCIHGKAKMPKPVPIDQDRGEVCDHGKKWVSANICYPDPTALDRAYIRVEMTKKAPPIKELKFGYKMEKFSIPIKDEKGKASKAIIWKVTDYFHDLPTFATHVFSLFFDLVDGDTVEAKVPMYFVNPPKLEKVEPESEKPDPEPAPTYRRH